MGLIDGGKGGGKLGSRLDLAEKMRAYTFQRRIRSSAFVFVVFAALSIIPLLILPAVHSAGAAAGTPWMAFLNQALQRLSSDWLLLVVFLISITNLLLLCGVVFMLYAVLNAIEHQ